MMAQLLPNSFTSYQLSEEERLSGESLTTLNEQVIQNLISALAEEKLNLTYTPESPTSYALRAAELIGQIGILKLLLETSSIARISLSSPTFQE